MPTRQELKALQSLPLEIKIAKSKQRIREWVERFGVEGVYVSFSGGKDSTVLLHLVRSMYPEVEAVFVDTGLEYPEIRQFVKKFDNVTILRPKMRFDEVIRKYGYPVISKEVATTIHGARNSIKKGQYSLRLCKLAILPGEYGTVDRREYDYAKTLENSKFMQSKWRALLDVDYNISSFCCNVQKKVPLHLYERTTGKVPFIGTMASESMNRETNWLHNGCNAFDAEHISSTPMAFWLSDDVLSYVKIYNLQIASVYGDVVSCDQDGFEYEDTIIPLKMKTTGCDRTGCIYCGFGCHLDKEPSRFQRLKETHPRQYEYCIGGGEYDEDGFWKPNKEGLGMGHVFDELNKIYGDNFIQYK